MQEDQVLATRPAPRASATIAYRDDIVRQLQERRAALDAALVGLTLDAAALAEAATTIVAALRGGRKVLTAGNGGSAAEAQHFAAELVGRFRREREPYAVLALTTDSAIVTAVANDYGYEHVFARQVEALGRPGDVFVAFSTSGESENLLAAAEAARGAGLTTIAVTGARPCRLERLADQTLRAPLGDTPAVQEVHMIVTHVLCDVVEAELAGERRDRR